MRTIVQLFALTSLLMSLCIPAYAQKGASLEDIARKLGAELSDSGVLMVNGQELKKETRAITPSDRGLVTNENYLAQLLEYAPEGLVCGYIMRNAWRKNLWGIFLVKEKKKYYLVYKEEDKVQKRKIKSDQATILETSVNTQISKIEFDINNPVFTEVYAGFPEAFMVYEGDISFAVTPSKAAHYRAWKGHEYIGINDEYWQAEVDRFKQEDTNDDKPVALSQLTAEMILKVKAYDNYYYKLEKGEYVIEIEPISDETGEKPKYKEYPDGVKTSIIPVGTTVKELLSMLPDVETDKDGKLITKNGKEVVTSIVFDDQMLYPKNNNPIYTDDYKLEEGILHIQIIDLDYFKERSWSPLPGDPTEGTARIRINYHPGKDASFIIRHSPDDIRQSGQDDRQAKQDK